MIKRFGVSILGRILGAVLQLAVFGAIARSLSVNQFGAFSIAITVAMLSLVLFDFGMGTRILRGANDSALPGALGTFLITRASIALAFPAIALLVSLATGVNPEFSVFGVVYAIGESSGDIAVGSLQGKKRSKSAMVLLITRRSAVLGALLAWPNVLGVGIAAGVSGIIGMAALIILLFSSAAKPIGLFRMVRQNLAIITTSGASSLGQADTLLVGATLGAYGAAQYSSATRLLNPLNLLVSTLMQVFVPELAASPTQESRLRAFRKVRNVVAVFALALFALAPFAPFFVTLIYGAKYSAAAPVATAVFIAAGLSALGQVHLAWFYSKRVPRSIPLMMWLSVGAGLVSVSILSSWIGLPGAALGLVCLQAMTNFSIVFIWFRHVRTRPVEHS